jgi:hypothetical protein
MLDPGANSAAIMSLLGRNSGMRAVAGGTQGDILTDPKLLAHVNNAFTPAAPAASFDERFPAPAAPEEPMTPQARLNHGFNMFGPSASRGIPTMASQNLPTPMDNLPPAAAPAVPMPTPRPEEAPQPPAPDMGFFARNTAMMRDPSSGAFIDPAAGESAQASGPDVINKLLSYFHNKET